MFLILYVSAYCLFAGQPVTYVLKFDNRVHHEAEIDAHFRDVLAGPFRIQMSRSSPGRYALHEFAKNIYNVSITDEDDKPLPFSRPDAHSWLVSAHSGTVHFHYTLFGNQPDGTYSGINANFILLNPPSALVWGIGLENRSHELELDLPDDWTCATQLNGKDSNWTAPNQYYLMDSPILLGPIQWFSWSQGTPEQTIRLALLEPGSPEEAKAYQQVCQAITAEAQGIFGELPNYDFGSYTFLAAYMPNAEGDGMEHRNSTVCSSTRQLHKDAVRLAGTIAHEFFHCWNVERLRPAALEPFDFTRVNVSEELWFAEGVTSYFDGLILCRSGVISMDAFLDGFNGDLNWVVLGPGRNFGSPAQMSAQAGFVDAARSVDPTNRTNTFISYYSYGAVLGLILDLQLRQQFNKSLDQFMQLAWQRFGKQEKPYSNQDLQMLLAEFTNPEFGNHFFEQSIYRSELPELQPLFEKAGLVWRAKSPQKAWWGNVKWVLETDPFETKVKDKENQFVTLASPTQVGTPLYRAGLEKGDILLALDDHKIKTLDDVKESLAKFKPGDSVEIEYRKNGENKKNDLELKADPAFELVPFEYRDLSVSTEQAQFRQAWLASQGKPLSLNRFCPECRRGYPFANNFCPLDGKELLLSRPLLDNEEDSDED
ncbi:MAG: M61 family metallopeptidase [Acidobacteria bacterium]|nr:M61 family metallopeptidase [Acidobacteriota bacterium]